MSVVLQGGLCFPTTVFLSHKNIYQNSFKIHVGSVLWPLMVKCVKQWENCRDSLRKSIRPLLKPLALPLHVLGQEAEITRKGRSRVSITETFCRDVRHGSVPTLGRRACRKGTVSKETKQWTLRREKRRTRREKVMEAERTLAPPHKIMKGCRK